MRSPIPTTASNQALKRMLCGVVILLFLAGWLLFGTHLRGTGEQRVSSRSEPSASTIPKSPNVPSRMILGEPLEARVSSKDNAATEWRKAFVLMDKLTNREKDLLKIKPPTDPAPTEAEITALLEKIDPIIMLLRAGAAKPECNWGLPQFLSFSTDMPHIKQMSLLGRIALWDSTQRVGKEPQEAVENLIAMTTLGNSLQAGTVSGWSNTIIQNWVCDFLSTHADSFSGLDRNRMKTIIDGSAYAHALQASFNTELDSIENSVRAFETGQKADGSPLTETEKRDFHTFFGFSFSETQILGHMQKIEEVRQQSLYWEDEEFQNWLSAYREQVFNPALLEAAESMTKMRNLYRKVLTDQQMVNAGWAAMEEGPTAISRLQDTLTGKPFGYRVLDVHGSFELQSEVLHNGKPVTMTFPRTSQ